MNVLRNPLRQVIRRSYATQQRPTFVPPTQFSNVGRPGGQRRRQRRRDDEDEDRDRQWQGDYDKQPPSSPNFYSGRAEYYDQVELLQDAIVQARKSLKAHFLLPLPEFARKALPPPFPMWKDQGEIATDFQSSMTRTRYRRVIKLLNELNGYLTIAKTANLNDVKVAIGSIVALFESGKKVASLAGRQKKAVSLDKYGRSYSAGKRKTSSARVWMIPVKAKPTQVHTEGSSQYEGVTASTIIVNNVPLVEYFPVPADRERIMRPFKVAGVVGAYNVFAIVRGGGTSGQSGAIAHGVAKGLVIHEPEVQAVLKKAQLTRRDPRMVERKKTGLAKARKRYTWVKR
ncbi:hypothetical protein H0H92_008323 [Tricholoma furcatifolium]|nr:hypothetical protein H0H92_008323 [Tricholoma furcatifolium]